MSVCGYVHMSGGTKEARGGENSNLDMDESPNVEPVVLTSCHCWDAGCSGAGSLWWEPGLACDS